MDTLEYFVNYNDVANKVASRKEELFRNVEDNVKSVILEMSPSQTLSFRIFNNSGRSQKVPIAANKLYAKVLWNFLKNRDIEYDGSMYKIESDVTTPILNCVERTIVEFYSCSETRESITSAISESISTSKIVQASVGKTAKEARKAIQNEVAIKMANQSLSGVRHEIINEVTNQVISFMNSNMMHQIVNTVGTCVATGAGKIIMSKIAIVLSKSISVAALKSVVMGVVKKIGLATIAKTAVGKSVALTLTTIGGLSANAAFVAALIPIIAVFLTYEYKSFPKKLAKKVPPQIVSDLRLHFDSMNEQIIHDIMSEMSKQISMQESNPIGRSWINKIFLMLVVGILLSILFMIIL